jgi:hypothetical protein
MPKSHRPRNRAINTALFLTLCPPNFYGRSNGGVLRRINTYLRHPRRASIRTTGSRSQSTNHQRRRATTFGFLSNRTSRSANRAWRCWSKRSKITLTFQTVRLSYPIPRSTGFMCSDFCWRAVEPHGCSSRGITVIPEANGQVLLVGPRASRVAMPAHNRKIRFSPSRYLHLAGPAQPRNPYKRDTGSSRIC